MCEYQDWSRSWDAKEEEKQAQETIEQTGLEQTRLPSPVPLVVKGQKRRRIRPRSRSVPHRVMELLPETDEADRFQRFYEHPHRELFIFLTNRLRVETLRWTQQRWELLGCPCASEPPWVLYTEFDQDLLNFVSRYYGPDDRLKVERNINRYRRNHMPPRETDIEDMIVYARLMSALESVPQTCPDHVQRTAHGVALEIVEEHAYPHLPCPCNALRRKESTSQ